MESYLAIPRKRQQIISKKFKSVNQVYATANQQTSDALCPRVASCQNETTSQYVEQMLWILCCLLLASTWHVWQPYEVSLKTNTPFKPAKLTTHLVIVAGHDVSHGWLLVETTQGKEAIATVLSVQSSIVMLPGSVMKIHEMTWCVCGLLNFAASISQYIEQQYMGN